MVQNKESLARSLKFISPSDNFVLPTSELGDSNDKIKVPGKVKVTT